MNLQSMTLIMIPEADLQFIKASLEEIKQELNNLNHMSATSVKYITASEFMAAVRIRRTKFDELVKDGKIRVIKKLRKIYVPVGEVGKYFSDSSVQ